MNKMWPSIDKEIKQLAKCFVMHVYLFDIPHLVHHYTLGLGQASHGNVCGKTYLLVVDSYSKWPEIWPTIFLRSNGIKHFKSAPYHGAVERLVQTLVYSLEFSLVLQKLKFIINKVYRRVIMTLIHTVLSTRSRAASHGL